MVLRGIKSIITGAKIFEIELKKWTKFFPVIGNVHVPGRNWMLQCRNYVFNVFFLWNFSCSYMNFARRTVCRDCGKAKNRTYFCIYISMEAYSLFLLQLACMM